MYVAKYLAAMQQHNYSITDLGDGVRKRFKETETAVAALNQLYQNIEDEEDEEMKRQIQASIDELLPSVEVMDDKLVREIGKVEMYKAKGASLTGVTKNQPKKVAAPKQQIPITQPVSSEETPTPLEQPLNPPASQATPPAPIESPAAEELPVEQPEKAIIPEEVPEEEIPKKKTRWGIIAVGGIIGTALLAGATSYFFGFPVDIKKMFNKD